MKMTKKKVFALALAVCLFAVVSMGTLAWFNDSYSITNTFKVANSDDDTDPTFSVEVFETDPETDDKTTDGVTYYDVLPGETIPKDPTVENTGDYDQWIRVTVTLDNANAWKTAGGTTMFTDLFFGSDYGLTSNIENAEEPWLLVSNEAKIDEDADTATWYLYLREKLSVGETAQLFETVKIPGDFTLDDMATFDEFTIKVQADALQHQNTGDNVVAAFKLVGWDDGTAYDAE